MSVDFFSIKLEWKSIEIFNAVWGGGGAIEDDSQNSAAVHFSHKISQIPGKPFNFLI